MTTWIIATRSRGKLAELVPMLAARGVRGIGLEEAGIAPAADEEGIEVFDSFAANAVAKASHFAARTGMPCIADDSGLCVDALDGAPGVRSRRFASDRGHIVTSDVDEDTANNDALIIACSATGRAPPWSAWFACAAAFCDRTRTIVADGRTDGLISPEPDGRGGFGYDPFFVSAELGMSFARATPDLKSAVSHRRRAIAALLERLGMQDGTSVAR